MIPPDQEIYEVEKRIAERRTRVERAFHDSGRQAKRALTSPWVLGAAALAGFVVVGALYHRRHRPEASPATKKAAKAGTASSLAMAAATWLVKSQFGSPLDMARFVLAKVKPAEKRRPAAAHAPSRVPDRLRPSHDRLRPSRREATTVG